MDLNASGLLTASGPTAYITPQGGVMALHLIGTWTGTWALLARRVGSGATAAVFDSSGAVVGTGAAHRVVAVCPGFEYAVNWTRTTGTLEYSLVSGPDDAS